MKWDTYKQLSSEDRIEWEWKFKDRTEWPRSNGLLYTVLLWSLLGISLMAYLVVSKEYIQTKTTLADLLRLASLSSLVMLVSWIAEYISNVCICLYYMYKEKEWLKAKVKNGCALS